MPELEGIKSDQRDNQNIILENQKNFSRESSYKHKAQQLKIDTHLKEAISKIGKNNNSINASPVDFDEKTPTNDIPHTFELENKPESITSSVTTLYDTTLSNNALSDTIDELQTTVNSLIHTININSKETDIKIISFENSLKQLLQTVPQNQIQEQLYNIGFENLPKKIAEQIISPLPKYLLKQIEPILSPELKKKYLAYVNPSYELTFVNSNIISLLTELNTTLINLEPDKKQDLLNILCTKLSTQAISTMVDILPDTKKQELAKLLSEKLSQNVITKLLQETTNAPTMQLQETANIATIPPVEIDKLIKKILTENTLDNQNTKDITAKLVIESYLDNVPKQLVFEKKVSPLFTTISIPSEISISDKILKTLDLEKERYSLEEGILKDKILIGDKTRQVVDTFDYVNYATYVSFASMIFEPLNIGTPVSSLILLTQKTLGSARLKGSLKNIYNLKKVYQSMLGENESSPPKTSSLKDKIINGGKKIGQILGFKTETSLMNDITNQREKISSLEDEIKQAQNSLYSKLNEKQLTPEMTKEINQEIALLIEKKHKLQIRKEYLGTLSAEALNKKMINSRRPTSILRVLTFGVGTIVSLATFGVSPFTLPFVGASLITAYFVLSRVPRILSNTRFKHERVAKYTNLKEHTSLDSPALSLKNLSEEDLKTIKKVVNLPIIDEIGKRNFSPSEIEVLQDLTLKNKDIPAFQRLQNSILQYKNFLEPTKYMEIYVRNLFKKYNITDGNFMQKLDNIKLDNLIDTNKITLVDLINAKNVQLDGLNDTSKITFQDLTRERNVSGSYDDIKIDFLRNANNISLGDLLKVKKDITLENVLKNSLDNPSDFIKKNLSKADIDMIIDTLKLDSSFDINKIDVFDLLKSANIKLDSLSIKDIKLDYFLNENKLDTDKFFNTNNITPSDMLSINNIELYELLEKNGLSFKDLPNAKNITLHDLMLNSNMSLDDFLKSNNISFANLVATQNIQLDDLLKKSGISADEISEVTHVDYDTFIKENNASISDILRTKDILLDEASFKPSKNPIRFFKSGFMPGVRELLYRTFNVKISFDRNTSLAVHTMHKIALDPYISEAFKKNYLYEYSNPDNYENSVYAMEINAEKTVHAVMDMIKNQPSDISKTNNTQHEKAQDAIKNRTLISLTNALIQTNSTINAQNILSNIKVLTQKNTPDNVALMDSIIKNLIHEGSYNDDAL